MKKINIADITLKKLSERRDLSLLFREKTAIALCADALGANAVELAPIKNLREDTIIYKTIAKNIKNATLTIPAGFTEEDVKNAFECIKEAKNPRLQIEVPTSTVQMEYTYHLKSDKMKDKIISLIKSAKELCEDVEFSALDATRADEDFLLSAMKEAENAGATIITICDDAGSSLPEEIAELVSKAAKAVSIPVYVQVSDKISMAVAAALGAIKAGAQGLKCAMTGEDTLLTGEICDAVSVCEGRLDAQTNLDKTKIHASIDDMLRSISHETYETQEDASGRSKILLDADTTIKQVAQAAETLGYDLSDSDCGNVHKALMHICEKKESVGARELEALIASYAMQAPSTYHLESYTTTTSNIAGAMTQVTLKNGDDVISGVSTGDGPIDSAFRAIEQCIGFHYELDDFQVMAVTEGKEALGSAVVKLREGGKLYSGNGISSDIVAASIRAYLNALNKIVFEEE